MSKFFISATLIFLFSYSFSQRYLPITVDRNEVTKVNFVTGDSVKCISYTYTGRIHDYEIDTVSGYITTQLRGIRNEKSLKNSGYVVRYDPANDKLKWYMDIMYTTQRVDQYGAATIQTIMGKSYFLDNETGVSLWKVRNSMIFADPLENIGIGYRISGGEATNMLEGYDLSNGKLIWKRLINNDFGWSDAFYINDSTLLIASSGLHTVNIRTGDGWDYDRDTGSRNYAAAAIGTGLGIAAGVLTGTYFTVNTGPNVISGVNSNVLMDSTDIYFASKSEIARMSKNGNEVWSTWLPAKKASASFLFKNKENIILINKGFAFKQNESRDFGDPFLASYIIESGKTNYLKEFDEDDIILDFEIQGDSIILLFNNRIIICSASGGIELFPHSYNQEEYGNLTGFAGEHVYFKSDSLFKNLYQNNEDRLVLITDKNFFLLMDNELKVEIKMPFPDDIYFSNPINTDLKLIENNEEAFIINSSGEIVNHFENAGNFKIIGQSMYFTQDEKLIPMDIW